MKSAIDHSKAHVEKRKAEGYTRETFWLSKEDKASLRTAFPGVRNGIDWQSAIKTLLAVPPEQRLSVNPPKRLPGKKSPIYTLWTSLKRVVLSKDLCASWQDSFEAFYDDVGDVPDAKAMIARKDESLPWQAGNWFWYDPDNTQGDKPATTQEAKPDNTQEPLTANTPKGKKQSSSVKYVSKTTGKTLDLLSSK